MPIEFSHTFANGREFRITIVILPFWSITIFESNKHRVYLHECNFVAGMRVTYATDNTWSVMAYTPILSLQFGYYDAE